MEIHSLTPDRWQDFVDLFARPGPRGGAGIQSNGCWCMWWRERTGDADRNKRAMHALVREGREPGLLGYERGDAVGWVSLAPREELGQLARSRKYASPRQPDGTWAIVCLYVHAASRHRGIAAQLVAAAVEHARLRGARSIEGYPHQRGDYMGSRALFERAGFAVVGVVEPRLVMRRRVSGRRPTARGRDRAGA